MAPDPPTTEYEQSGQDYDQPANAPASPVVLGTRHIQEATDDEITVVPVCTPPGWRPVMERRVVTELAERLAPTLQPAAALPDPGEHDPVLDGVVELEKEQTSDEHRE